MMLMHQQQQQQQQQGAAAGFSPPPNVTSPTGMDSPMAGPPINQPGQQTFNYGANYGELSSPSSVINKANGVFDNYLRSLVLCWMLIHAVSSPWLCL